MHEAEQLHTGYVESNGTQLYYEIMGKGQTYLIWKSQKSLIQLCPIF